MYSEENYKEVIIIFDKYDLLEDLQDEFAKDKNMQIRKIEELIFIDRQNQEPGFKKIYLHESIDMSLVVEFFTKYGREYERQENSN